MKNLRYIIMLLLLLSPVSVVETALAQVDAVAASSASKAEITAELAFAVEDVSDPLESVNRFFFDFNDLFYDVLLQPMAKIYDHFLPDAAQVGVNNFFQNLATPTHVVSALLQGELKQSGIEVGRFGINTVFGLAGFVDVAQHVGLPGKEEDLGQTLGRYGAGDTLYLVWPIIGPSNLRDSVGLVGDTLLNPLTYYPADVGHRAALMAHRTVNTTALHLGEYEDLRKSAIDPYISVRDAYLQHRRTKIQE